MIRVPFFYAITLILFAAGICRADSLVITYHSGKTQTVVLDEPSQGITSWQFVGGAAPRQQSLIQGEAPVPARQEQVQKGPAAQPQADVKVPDKAPEKKSGIRVKWNAKPISD